MTHDDMEDRTREIEVSRCRGWRDGEAVAVAAVFEGQVRIVGTVVNNRHKSEVEVGIM